MKLIKVIIAGVSLFSVDVLASERLDKRLPIYAIVKPNKISTQIALGSGIVHKIYHKIGNTVRPGTLLLEVIEKEGIRQYNNTVNGSVAKLHVTVGAATSVGMPLITVLDPNDKLLEVSLSPDEAKRVSVGDSVYLPSRDRPIAKISSISPLVDPDRGAVTCYLKPITKIRERVGEIIDLVIVTPSTERCDKVTLITQLGEYTSGWKVSYLSGDKACLKKAE